MKSVMAHNFSRTPTIDAPRSQFDRSCGHKFTADAGYLIPFYIDDVLPGDTFNLNATLFARMATPQYPVMDNMYVDTHFFFVPLRLVWENARKFFGEQVDPGDSIDYTIPNFSSFTPAEDTLHDYLGLPPGNAMTPNSIYHRGYNLIWNEWFRDQNLQDSVHVDLDDGPDTESDYVLLRRGKRHDYFTSALPSPQKGDAVSIPLGTTATITGTGNVTRDSNAAAWTAYDAGTDNVAGTQELELSAGTLIEAPSQSLSLNPNGGLTADLGDVDLTTATAATVNDFREAFQVQKLLERDARGGTRYSELVNNHFGVNFYDVSYRPEFLGGGSTPVNVNQVASTNTGYITGVGVTNQVGDLGAFATAAASGHGFSKSFVEHGFVIGLCSIRADLTYQQGLSRFFTKQTRYDIYWPSLAHLGEQEVLNQEIYHQGAAADEEVFGYQERYAEYRYNPSRVSSQFRSSHTTPLDAWHLSQEFSTLPQLGNTFIQEDPPLDRVIQTPTEPHFIFDTYTMLKCARPMPVFGVPGMIDHF